MLTLGLLVFLASGLFTGAMRTYALKHNVMDNVTARSSHQQPTPRGGGLAIVITFYLGLLVFNLTEVVDFQLNVFLWLGLCIAAIGFWDDHVDIPARWRLLVHTITSFAVMLMFSGMPEMTVVEPSFELGLVAVLIGVAGLTWGLNLFNFMDGTDGIAASETIFLCLALAILLSDINPDMVPVLLILASSAAGFLCWNWPKAKIFMGDVSSGFLGFVMSLVILHSAIKEPVVLFGGLILFGVFVVDASYTLLYRYVDGQNCLQAHCTHAYQRAAKKFSHLNVLLTVWAINILWLFPMAYGVMHNPEYNVIGLAVAYLPLIILAHCFKAGRLQE